MKGTELAPEGKVWVCTACGKRSLTRYGFIDNGVDGRGSNTLADGSRVADRGWDVSCVTHAELVEGSRTP